VTATATWTGASVTTTWLDKRVLLWTNTEQELGQPIVTPPADVLEEILGRTRSGYVLDENDLWDPVPEKSEGAEVFQLKWKQIHTVTFVANGVTLKEVSDNTIYQGATLSRGIAPSAKNAQGVEAQWLYNDKLFVFGENGTPVDGDMTLTATWDEIPEEEPIAKFTYNMSLADNLNLNYYVRDVRADVVPSDIEIVVTVEGKEGTVTKTFKPDNPNETMFTIASLDARRMTDNINIVVKHNGATVKNDDYSIKDYCEAVKARSTNDKLNALIDAVLVYGSNAQELLKYKHEDYPIEPYDVTGVNIDPASASKLGNVTGVNAFANRVLVKSTVTLQVLIRLNSDANLDDLTIYVDNQVYDKANLIKQSTNIYVVSIPVSALKLDVNHSVIVTNEDGTMAVYTVSAQVPMSKTNNDLAKALWAYFKAANEFYGTL
jgi:hypothetical protein